MSRLHDPLSIIIGRSRCTRCKKRLAPLDLVPVVSFLILRGRCRYCRKPIGYQYLFLEVFCGLLAILVYFLKGLSIPALFLFISLSFLGLASIVDIKDQEVDLPYFGIGIISALLYSVTYGMEIRNIYMGAISFAALPLVLYAISRERWMGLGDTFFALWAGILVGFPQSLILIFIAFFLGAVFGIMKLLTGASSHRIAFGPFLAFSAILGIIWPQEILDLYLQIFF